MDQRIGKQRGWVGLIAILLALVIVAWLAKDSLKQYGLLGMPDNAADSPRPTGLQRSPTPAAVSDFSGSATATPSFQAPVERARGVEETVRRGAESQSRQVEDSTR